MKRRDMVCAAVVCGMCLSTPTLGFEVTLESKTARISEAAARLEQSLRETRVNVSFVDARCGDVLQFLGSEELKPGGEKLNIVLLVADRKLREKIEKERTVTLDLKNVPLYDAIKYLSKLLGLGFRIEDHAVVLHTEVPGSGSSGVGEPSGQDPFREAKSNGKESLEMLRKQEDIRRAASRHGHQLIAMNNMRQLLTAARMYRLDKGAWPETIEALRPYFTKDFDLAVKNPRTGANPGFLYTAPPASAGNRDQDKQTAVLFELDARGQRDPAGAIGYLDGRVAPPARSE